VQAITRRILAVLITGLTAGALAPAAGASITPALTLDQSHGTGAGSTVPLGLDLKFAPSASDSPKDLTLGLPPGLLADASIDGGACLHSRVPVAACQVGTGSVTATTLSLLPLTIPVTFDLVAPPKPGDLAGVATMTNLLGSPTQLGTAGEITLRSGSDPAGIGLNIALSNLPNTFSGMSISLDELQSNFAGLRLPTSCPAPSARITVTADSYSDPTAKTTSAPLSVTNCSKLAFTPAFHLTAVRNATDVGVQIATDVTQPATPAQATSRTVKLTLPGSVLEPNAGTAGRVVCANAASGTCQAIGSATSVSPLYPTPLDGKVYLTGTKTRTGLVSSPAISIVFPAPFALTLSGTVDIGTDSTTFQNVPDIPLTRLGVTLTGGRNAVFLATCHPPTGTASSTSTTQNGDRIVVSSSRFTVSGCPGPRPARPGRPRAGGGSLSGLASGAPSLRFAVSAGANAPNVKSFTIGLPGGLRFHAARGHSSGVRLGGGQVQSLRLVRSRLLVVLRRATRRVVVKIHAPALTESAALQQRAKLHKVSRLRVTVAIKDRAGNVTTSTLTI
jgi:hypothetical protein